MGTINNIGKLSYLNTQINTYVHLYHAAYCALENAKSSSKGDDCMYCCMSANLMTAFCVEAYLNHICESLFPFWNEEMKKDLRTENKLHLVFHTLEMKQESGKRPYQSLKDIWKFRNIVVHAKTERIQDKSNGKIPISDLSNHYTKSWWEGQCKIGVTKKWLEDIELIIKEIHKKQGNEDDPFLVLRRYHFSSGPDKEEPSILFEDND